MAKEYRVNVYDGDTHSPVVARVLYNQDLDYWDGRNWTSGNTGRHLGASKLKDGRYVLIHGTQWQGERDYGVVVSPEEMLQVILQTGHADLIETPKFKSLKALCESLVEEEIFEDGVKR